MASYSVSCELDPLQETGDPEGDIALGGFSFQMDWGQYKQKGPTLSSSVLRRV